MKYLLPFLAIFALISFSSQSCLNYDADFCATLPNGFHPSPDFCTNWIRCADGLFHTCGACPGGFYFDPSQGGCYYADLVECDSSAARCTPGMVHRVPIASSCTKYFQCIGVGDPIQQTCAEGLQFDKETEQCDLRERVRCLRETYPLECPETTEPFTQEPHPWACDRFFMCINGVATERFCVDGMSFDKNVRECRATAVAECILDAEN